MSAIDLGSLALAWIAAYGAPMLAGLLFIGGVGLPLPGTLLVIASGAFVRQNLLDSSLTPLLGYLGSIGGDVL
jgi:membrane-associated protein